MQEKGGEIKQMEKIDRKNFFFHRHSYFIKHIAGDNSPHLKHEWIQYGEKRQTSHLDNVTVKPQ